MLKALLSHAAVRRELPAHDSLRCVAREVGSCDVAEDVQVVPCERLVGARVAALALAHCARKVRVAARERARLLVVHERSQVFTQSAARVKRTPAG